MPEQSIWDVVFSPPVLVTVIICAILAGLVIWIRDRWRGRRQQVTLADQRRQQEATVERLLEATTADKQRIIAEYEQQLRERDARIAGLEHQVERLRDRVTAGGLVGVFGGGKQRDTITALLLENEQLHELLAEKQVELRDVIADLTDKLVQRLDAQAQDSARAVRYKQALLSAFLEREETRRLLNDMLASGDMPQEPRAPELPAEPPAPGHSEDATATRT